MPYALFVIGMLVAGTGAAILNGETVKVLVPPFTQTEQVWHPVFPAQRASLEFWLALEDSAPLFQMWRDWPY